MRTIVRFVVLAMLFAALLPGWLSSQESGRKTKRAPTLVVSLSPASGYTPLGGPLVVEGTPRSAPEEFMRARELFRFQILANRPDDPGGDAPTTVVAHGLVRRGETTRVRGGYKDLAVTGRISLKTPGIAKYEAELTIDGKPVSSTAATLHLDAVR